MTGTTSGHSAHDDLSIVELTAAVVRKWRLVIVLPLTLATVVAVWSIVRPRMYSASASFMPQVSEGRAGGAAAIAQQFGVNLGGDRPGESAQFYVNLLRTRTLLRETIGHQYEIPRPEGGVWQGTLLQYWDLTGESNSRSVWQEAASRFSDAVSASATPETGVVRITATFEDPVLAEQVAARLLDVLNTFNLEVRQKRAEAEGRFIGSRIDSAGAELLVAEEALQEFLHRNRDFGNSPQLVFDHDRLQRTVAMRQDLYTSLLRSLEQARIDAVRDVPLFTVIDEPAGSAVPRGRGTVLRVILAFTLGLTIAVFVALLAEYSRRRKQSGDPRYLEFVASAREAWHDVRHPRKWLRTRTPAGGGD